MLGRSNGHSTALRAYVRRALLIVAVLLIAACSGGGCSSGCSSCGLTPLVEPIPTADIISNAGSLRVTRSGLDFIAASAPTLAGNFLNSGSGGVFEYEVQKTTTSTLNATICTTGPNETSNPQLCTADIDLGNATFHVDAVTPDAVTVSGTLPVKVEDLPVSATEGITLTVYVGVGSNGSCSDSGTPSVDYQPFPFTVTIPLIADTIAPRVGYTKVDAANVAVDVTMDESDVQICADCSFLSVICDPILDGVKDLAFSTLQSDVQSALQSAVVSELCTKPDSSNACPAGSALDTSTGNCDYTAQPGTCLPIELGVDGELNLGSLLQKISYGTTSNLDVSLAAGGAMIPANAPTAPTGSPADNVGYTGHTPNGITLGMIGAALPDPTSSCVPQASNPVPFNIPIPVELEENAVTPWASTDPPGPQVGVALAARFLNYALGSVYNSGGLCLGITSDTFSELNSGLLTLLAPSIKYLTFQQQSAAVAITTRPQVPPTVTIGDGTNLTTDPLILVTLNQFALDFYIFSDAGFQRAFTYTADITLPVNLSTAVTASNPTGEIVPTLGSLVATNGVVTNSELLLDSPTKIATGVSGVLGAITGQLTGSIPNISLASLTSSLGVSLTIPADGIRKLTSGTDDFLALFGDLALDPSAQVSHVTPQARLVGQEIHPEVMTLQTYDVSKLPTLHVTVGTEGETSPVEYAYWIDQGTRSPWTTETSLTIQNQTLFLQGYHTLYVTARRVGDMFSESLGPASVPLLIDVVPPTMTLTATDTGATLTAWDYVSPTSALLARMRITDASGNAEAWSDWQPLADLATITAPKSPLGSSSVGVEVRDEAGNVATSEVALIRGQNDEPAAASACGCSTPGTNTRLGGGGTLMLLALGGALVTLLRRVRRTAARAPSAPLEQRRRPARSRGALLAATTLGIAVGMGALSQGCSCGGANGATLDGGNVDSGDGGGGGKVDGGREAATNGDTGGPQTSGCGPSCNGTCLPSLPEGIIGAYTSIAKDLSGNVWVAGYDDSAVSQAYMGLYGDLVVGKYDTAKSLVDWTTVDGVGDAGPGCPLYDPTGWRGGVTAAGADVGLWTSIQLDANDHPIVSYYDATNQALKFASSTNGTTWSSYTVMQTAGSDIGRYSKTLVVNGVPVIVFLIMEPGTSGKMRSRVEVATGTVATPASATDWTFEDAAVDDDGPCRPAFCPSPGTCITETGECSPPATGCGSSAGDAGGDAGDAATTAACSNSQVCVGGFDAGPSCGTPMSSSYIDIYPNAFGDYITVAKTPTTSNGFGIVVYDRINGALVQLAKWNGTWVENTLDSETGARAPNPGPDGGITPFETGDVGVGADLFITTTGDWHVSYVNGTSEALQYIMVPGGNQQPSAPEVVDNGTMLNGAPYPDGQHIVGDDSSLQVDSMGNVTISYQDSTGGVLLVATGMPESGGGHTWAVVAASQPNKWGGFFSHSVVGDTSSFSNFWRQTDMTTSEITGNVTFVAP
jgi:hypothetical protein